MLSPHPGQRTESLNLWPELCFFYSGMVRFLWLAVAGLRKEREQKGGDESECWFWGCGEMLALEFSQNEEIMELGVVVHTCITSGTEIEKS